MDFTKDGIIKELTDKLERSEAIRRSETERNYDLLVEIEKQNLHINTLQGINENFSRKISILQLRLKDLITKT